MSGCGAHDKKKRKDMASFKIWIILKKFSSCQAVVCRFDSSFLMQYDQDYHPGRRKRGKDYKEDMVNWIASFYKFIIITYLITWEKIIVSSYLKLHKGIDDNYLIVFWQYELPFYYPGQVSCQDHCFLLKCFSCFQGSHKNEQVYDG